MAISITSTFVSEIQSGKSAELRLCGLGISAEFRLCGWSDFEKIRADVRGCWNCWEQCSTNLISGVSTRPSARRGGTALNQLSSVWGLDVTALWTSCREEPSPGKSRFAKSADDDDGKTRRAVCLSLSSSPMSLFIVVVVVFDFKAKTDVKYLTSK